MGILQEEYWSGLPSVLQGIFPTQGSNPGLPHCRQILYCLSTGEAWCMKRYLAAAVFAASVVTAQAQDIVDVAVGAGGFTRS